MIDECHVARSSKDAVPRWRSRADHSSQCGTAELRGRCGQQIEGVDVPTQRRQGDRVPVGIWWRRTDDAVAHQDADFKFRATLDWKPVKLITNGRRDVGKFWDVENESRRSIEDRLQTVQPASRNAAEDAVAIVDPIADESARECEQGSLRQAVPNNPQPSKLVEAGTTELIDVSIHRQLAVQKYVYKK